ncbi:hypothetical protein K438DRAFT_1776222 [Mycena galopus ATCC 62051]|nr:hypothetical protein K438DRAFT_1776222 [Mycena galopus ATCC 62051]
MATSDFTNYSSPYPSTLYSATYFSELTFNQAAELDFPTIYRPNTILAWTFTDDIPTAVDSTVQLDEGIPNSADLLPIQQEMENKYSESARSVAVKLRVAGQAVTRVYHFSKIRLFVHLNNNKMAVESARALVAHLCTADIVPLSELEDEEWVHNDVLNALAEILYFRQAVLADTSLPSTLILPTHFLNDARYLFDKSPRLLSANLVALCRRIESTSVNKIFALNCSLNHCSVYRACEFSGLTYRDSMRLHPDANVLSIFQWFLSTTGFAVPTSVDSADGEIQNADSGSCAIAALNFVETYLNPSCGVWNSSMSPSFRNSVLRDLILYHLTASDQGVDNIYDELLPCSDEPSVDCGPFGYNDFNLLAPNLAHPIHRFLEIFSPANGQPQPIVRAQPEDFPFSLHTVRPMPLLLSPFTEVPRISTSPFIKLERTPEPSSSMVIDLCTPSPTPKRVSIKTETITPEPFSSGAEPIDLFLDPVNTPLSPCISEEENVIHPLEPAGSTEPLSTVDTIRVGSFYPTLEQGKVALYAAEGRGGHVWRTGQTRRSPDGQPRRITYRCNHYGEPNATHRDEIDPSDHREGRSIRKNCTAHVNFASTAGGWHVTVADFEHNHPPQIPVGGHIPCPPTAAQRELVATYASTGNFTRTHLSHILRARFPDHVLEPQQVSNMINTARKEANQLVQELGGDIQTVFARLRELKEEDPRWDWDVKFDENHVVVAIWWQSPTQVDLARQFYDILINDNTYCRNQYGYPLNIGIVIDNFGSVSPAEFDRLWNILVTRYPAASEYLDTELYSCRSHWAWAWVSNVFTGGVRTTGRAEGENRINKIIGGPKKTFLQLFEGLNQRSQDQTTKELVQVRESSSRRHESNLESLFVGPLKMLRDYAGPFALQTCYKQMQLSLFYTAENEYVVQVGEELGYDWSPGEEKQMLNAFENDKAHISVKWLLQLVTKRGLSVVSNPDATIESVPAVCRTRELGPQEFRLPARTIRSAFASNPLDSTSHESTPPPATQTVPARDVFHNVQAAIRPLIAGIQTREQVADLIHNLEGLHQQNIEEARQNRIFNPPIISHKGRPRTARLTNAREVGIEEAGFLFGEPLWWR